MSCATCPAPTTCSPKVDAAVTYTLTRRISLNASVENLLDRRYYLFYRNAGRLASGSLRVRF